jgi:hypothetical protein
MTLVKRRYTVTIVKEIVIEIDEDKMTEEAMTEFNSHIHNIGLDKEAHFENIAAQCARENWWNGDKFLEGYGDLGDEFGAYVVMDDEISVETEREKT